MSASYLIGAPKHVGMHIADVPAPLAISDTTGRQHQSCSLRHERRHLAGPAAAGHRAEPRLPAAHHRSHLAGGHHRDWCPRRLYRHLHGRLLQSESPWPWSLILARRQLLRGTLCKRSPSGLRCTTAPPLRRRAASTGRRMEQEPLHGRAHALHHGAHLRYRHLEIPARQGAPRRTHPLGQAAHHPRRQAWQP